MKRVFLIGLFAILMLTVIVVGNYSFQTSTEEATVSVERIENEFIIPSEKGVFERSDYALDYVDMPKDDKVGRSLNSYYNNRAFHGAPPYIPHPVNDDGKIGDNDCLKCHQNGGYVEKFKAYTPVVPHPTYVNCKQCHVSQKTTTVFKATNWEKVPAPGIGNAALQGSPPIIPHQTQLHENCLACHAGPAAPKEIRVTHPERINCRQCHVTNNKELIDIGDFIR